MGIAVEARPKMRRSQNQWAQRWPPTEAEKPLPPNPPPNLPTDELR